MLVGWHPEAHAERGKLLADAPPMHPTLLPLPYPLLALVPLGAVRRSGLGVCPRGASNEIGLPNTGLPSMVTRARYSPLTCENSSLKWEVTPRRRWWRKLRRALALESQGM